MFLVAWVASADIITHATKWHVAKTHPSKQEAFTQCCFNVGPPSSTLAQHWNSIGWMPLVWWDMINLQNPLHPAATMYCCNKQHAGTAPGQWNHTSSTEHRMAASQMWTHWWRQIKWVTVKLSGYTMLSEMTNTPDPGSNWNNSEPARHTHREWSPCRSTVKGVNLKLLFWRTILILVNPGTSGFFLKTGPGTPLGLIPCIQLNHFYHKNLLHIGTNYSYSINLTLKLRHSC